MKKLFLLFFTVCSFIMVDAQIGIKAGVNLANLQREGQPIDFENIEEGTVLGFEAGLMYRLSITESLKLQPELMLIQKGGTQNYEQPAIDQKTEINTFYNYIELPILLQYYLGLDGTGFFVEAGPFLGIAMTGREDITTELGGETFEATTDFDYSEEASQKRADYGFAFGVGYVFNKISIGVRYNLGVNNLLDEDANNNNDQTPKLSTRGLAVGVGYYF